MDGMAGVGSDQREERGDRQAPEPAPEPDRDAAAAAADQPDAGDAEVGDHGGPSSVINRKRLIQTAVVVLLLIGGIYFLFPKIVGVQGTVNRLGDATPGWLAVALAMDVAAYLAYVALF